jgi:hypothetical protein
MITNLPDAIEQIVTDMKVGYVADSYTTTATYTDITYTSGKNQLQAGMYVEFPDDYENKRFKIATFTENKANNYTIRINSALTFEAVVPGFHLFLNFYFGHAKDIQRTISELTKQPTRNNNKFPMLALFIDYTEKRGEYDGLLFSTTVNPALIIDSQKHWGPDNRLTYSFKQTLYPLYDEFIDKAIKSGLFELSENSELIHDKTDRYYYSADDAKTQNTLAIVADAIEINNIQLNLLRNTLNCT